MSKKRILIFSLTYEPFIGGAELAVKHITDRFDPHEWEFDLVTLRFDRRLPKRKRIGNVNVIRVGFSFRGATIRDTFKFPLSLNKYWFPFASAVRAFFLHRKHRYDAVWSIMANYAGFGALFFKRMHTHVPLVLTLQEGDPIEHIIRRVGWLRPIFQKIFTRADRVQAISKFLAEFAEGMGVPSERINVVPNGVDREKFRAPGKLPRRTLHLKDFKIAKDDTVLITTSRLVEKNAVDIIIASLRFLPPSVKLLIAGTGPLEEQLKLKTTNYQLETRVRFLGHIDHDELPKYLEGADIYVRPSRSEGLGSSFLEAMAAGVPIIATPVGGIPDFLTDGETGLFCDVDNPESLAEKVALLANDRVMYKRISQSAQQLIAERYDWDVIQGRMEKEVFNKVFM